MFSADSLNKFPNKENRKLCLNNNILKFNVVTYMYDNLSSENIAFCVLKISVKSKKTLNVLNTT